MPELPEVETIVRELLNNDLINKKIVSVNVFWSKSIAMPDEKTFYEQIKGQKIVGIERRGKFIKFSLSKDTLLVHLRMTGKFLISKIGKKTESLPHERLSLVLSDGRELHYYDQRKFGKWYLLLNPQDILSKLGIEPLSEEFSLEFFQNLLNKHSTQIKPFLLNQSHIVGLGNIYVDEALWNAKIHPKQPANTLTLQQIQRLHKAIAKVLLQGIEQQGTTLGSHQANYFSVSGRRGGNQFKLNVFRREGEKCPRCQATIIKITVAQRGTHLCPICQAAL